MRIATWNVNSIRARVDRVTDWLERADVDVLAMQETKCADDQFPTMPFAAIGYEVVHCGFNQWNGVAIASRVGIDDVQVGFDGQPTWSSKPSAARGGPRTGRDVRRGAGVEPVRSQRSGPDSPHYYYKLEWLAALRDTARGWLTDDPAPRSHSSATGTSPPPTTTCGASSSSATARTSPSRSGGRSAPSSTPNSPTWCGRSRPGPGSTPTGTTPSCGSRKKQGMRIDFILGSPALADRVTHAEIVRDERKGKAPSDHAPVLVELG